MSDANLDGLEERVAAIEARQRAYGQHDPTCPTFLTEVAQRQTDMYFPPPACDCWLTESA